MVSYDDFYKDRVGVSKDKGSLLGCGRKVKFLFHENLFSSSNARLRTGFGVLSLGLVLGYVINKEKVDSRFEGWKDSYSGFWEDRRVAREERRTLNLLDGSREELEGIRDEIVGLEAYRSDLESSVRDYDSRSRGVSGSSGNDLWVAVRPGGSLSEIARDYYGSAGLFRELAEFNNISNPDLVFRNQPIKLCPSRVVNYDGVIVGDVPLFKRVHRDDYLSKFIFRNNIPVSNTRIIDYNRELGNFFTNTGNLIDFTDVVYLKKDWVK